MYFKLAFRNVKRSLRDYLIYLMNMMLITALMYAFNSLYFLESFGKRFDASDIMSVMVCVATAVVLPVAAWLVHYMLRFMMERRSREFGVYLLLGMKKRNVRRLYMWENHILSAAAFVAGIPAGVLLQQVVMAALYTMLREKFTLQFGLDFRNVRLTFLCYAGFYLLAALRCRRRFRRMNIQSLMNAQRENEEIREEHVKVLQLCFPAAVCMLIALWAVFGRIRDMGQVLLFLLALVVSVYLFYIGISAWIVCRIREKKGGIYKNQNLLLLRQFASKVRTMQFTMGSLTVLFTLAVMGASVAFMLNHYENTILKVKYPFDVQIYGGDPSYEFAAERETLQKYADIKETYQYPVYTDGTSQANDWLLGHLKSFEKSDGGGYEEEGLYYETDTYMALSDYNHLREMLGYEKVALKENEYIIHVKERLLNEVQLMEKGLQVLGGNADGSPKELTFAGFQSEPFSQDGHNGADYLLIVPDLAAEKLMPYYTVLVAEIQGETPEMLQQALDEEVENRENGESYMDQASGTDSIAVYIGECLVAAQVVPEIKMILASVILPAFYIGLIFICIAMTVLSVQQLSESGKYQRYCGLLSRLGMRKRGLTRLVRRQMTVFYLCPALLAALIGGKLVLTFGGGFVKMTGIHANASTYFLLALTLFGGMYLLYFLVTYVMLKRNVLK